MTYADIASTLSQKIDDSRFSAGTLLDRYNGYSPMSYLSPQARAAVGDKLTRVSANFCRVAVDELAQRLRIVGTALDGQHDADLWQRWSASGMVAGSNAVTKGALITGRAAVSVWANGDTITVRPESALQTAWNVDPLTGRCTEAMKVFPGRDGKPKAMLFLPDRLVALSSPAYVNNSPVPPDQWVTIGELPNPLGIPALIPVTNALTTESTYGDSEMSPLVAANDLLEKLLTDAAVSSEFYARPLRYISGLESLPEDEAGNPVEPFGDGMRTWVTTEVDAKIGQLAGSVGDYDKLISQVLQVLAGLSGLPANVLGVSHSNPTSSDAITASGLTLTSRAEDRATIHNPSWNLVVSCMASLRDGGDPLKINGSIVRADARYSSEAAEADAVTKLFGAGLLSRGAALRRLGYTPDEISEIEADVAREATIKALMSGDAA